MSRKIDLLPEPTVRQPKRVIVVSPSRSGTLGIYRAMQILGFKAYHLFECIMVKGKDDMEIYEEAVIAQNNRYSGIKRYDRADFDKWFSDYDCLVEVPAHLGPSIIDAYVDEPDVKFILVERNPAKWVASIDRTAGPLLDVLTGFPIAYLKYFNAVLHRFVSLNLTVIGRWSDGSFPDDSSYKGALHRNYVEYIQLVKRTVPADRLLHIHLEDGLGWAQICPFIGVPIPKEDYPDRNQPEKFQVIAQKFLEPHINAALARFALVTVSSLSVIGWVSMKYGSFLSNLIREKL